MAVFPRIQRSCPYKDRLAAAMDGDICRICDHQVIDLTAWSDEERIAFAAGQKEAVCISYRVPLRPALAAAALAAAALPNMAAAQDAAAPTTAEAPADEPEPQYIVGTFGPARAPEGPAVTVFEADQEPESYEIVGLMSPIGAVKDPANTSLVTAEELAAIPEVPVAYEDEPAADPPADPKA
jgi:hypothetical protein